VALHIKVKTCLKIRDSRSPVKFDTLVDLMTSSDRVIGLLQAGEEKEQVFSSLILERP
jgi:hypothetical protein